MSKSAEILEIRCNALEKYCISLKKELESAQNDLKSLQTKHDKILLQNQVLQEKISRIYSTTTPSTEEVVESGFDNIENMIEASKTLDPIKTTSTVPPPVPSKKNNPAAKPDKQPRQNQCLSCGEPMSSYTAGSYWDCSLGRHVTSRKLSCSRCSRSGVMAC